MRNQLEPRVGEPGCTGGTEGVERGAGETRREIRLGKPRYTSYTLTPLDPRAWGGGRGKGASEGGGISTTMESMPSPASWHEKFGRLATDLFQTTTPQGLNSPRYNKTFRWMEGWKKYGRTEGWMNERMNTERTVPTWTFAALGSWWPPGSARAGWAPPAASWTRGGTAAAGTLCGESRGPAAAQCLPSPKPVTNTHTKTNTHSQTNTNNKYTNTTQTDAYIETNAQTNAQTQTHRRIQTNTHKQMHKETHEQINKQTKNEQTVWVVERTRLTASLQMDENQVTWLYVSTMCRSQRLEWGRAWERPEIEFLEEINIVLTVTSNKVIDKEWQRSDMGFDWFIPWNKQPRHSQDRPTWLTLLRRLILVTLLDASPEWRTSSAIRRQYASSVLKHLARAIVGLLDWTRDARKEKCPTTAAVKRQP